MRATMKIIVYGMGVHYKKNEKFIFENFEVVGYIDKIEQQCNIKRFDINELFTLPEHTKIMITSINYFAEMLNSLLQCGVDMRDICYLDNEMARVRSKNVFYSYSQYGEDYIISSLMGGLKGDEIKYLELGVDDPVLGNNTFNLDLRGAQGWLVEANLEMIPCIELCRRNCMILNKVVVPDSSVKKKVKFYVSDISATSSVYPETISENCGTIIREIDVEPISLQELLKMTGKVHVLSVDLEGMDREILLSTTFDEKYGPDIICAETRETDDEIVVHMNSQKYDLVYLNGVNSIWKKRS